jgi:hypothetical protein
MNIQFIYSVFGRFFRTRRMEQFAVRFNLTTGDSVLDVGGTEFNWTLLDTNPTLYFVNLSAPAGAKNWVIADGCALPFASHSFDVVFSNSVIEHLGTWSNQQKFAAECRRVGMHYYIQTPNKWFFIEPHMLTPFIHWLPKSWQRRLLKNFTIRGLLLRPDQAKIQAFLDEIRLMDETEMRELFPEAEIWKESFLGFTKSFIAAYKPNSSLG